MIEGNSGLISLCKILHISYVYKAYKQLLIIQECKILFFGGDKFDKLRGYEFDFVWLDELCKFQYTKEVLSQIDMCLRLGISRMIISTTPVSDNSFLQILNSKKIHITNGTSLDNNIWRSGNFRTYC